eukprot:Skav225371  [mRNA]  locus=scaffold329:50737:52119:+ [translate_table: standard]
MSLAKVWMSMQQMLAWQPTNLLDANQEFEDGISQGLVSPNATDFSAEGEHRTVDLKPGGADLAVNFDTRREYVAGQMFKR